MSVLHIDDVKAHRWEFGEIGVTRKRLGVAGGAKRMGVAILEMDPGKRSTPPHSHADEEEVFFVVAGSGLSYQTSGSKDVRTYEIRQGDFLVHPSNGPAHTLIAGPEGLTVLVVAEGSRTGITYMPRTKMFWLGPRWVPADAPPPFVADAALGPLALPDPTPERPPTIKNLDELEWTSGDDGELAYNFKGPQGAERLVMGLDDMPPNRANTTPHWHTTREEVFYVLSGSGHARIGDDAHELRAGSFFVRPPNSGVPHRTEVGPDGMELITMGDLVDGDLAVQPQQQRIRVANGVYIPYTP